MPLATVLSQLDRLHVSLMDREGREEGYIWVSRISQTFPTIELFLFSWKHFMR